MSAGHVRELAGGTGFEPATSGLTIRSSTTELPPWRPPEICTSAAESSGGADRRGVANLGAVRGRKSPRNWFAPLGQERFDDQQPDSQNRGDRAALSCNPDGDDASGCVKPVRLQLKRTRGFNLQALSLATNGLPAVNCTRRGRYGNPFRLLNEEGAALIEDTRDGSAWGVPWADAERQVVAAFERHIGLPENAGFRAEAIENLRGKNLACWCRLHQPFCHVNVWLRIANEPPA
jgi:hypothetical protein